jgi:hypothetical protein
MVLHRPIECTRITGHVVLAGFYFSGNGVYQDLARSRPIGNRLYSSSVQGRMKHRSIASFLLLVSPCVYAQSDSLKRPIANFTSEGVGLTETILKFAQAEHFPVAVEYVDRTSMDQPIAVNLQNKTVRQALDSILSNGLGYSWLSRNGIVEITNRRASRHAEGQLNTVIPVFEISEGETVNLASAILWWNLQIAVNPSLKDKGFGGSTLGRSSSLKATTLHERTVREILSYIVLNSRAEGWIVAGPPECLGFTPHCGLWFIIEGESFGSSYQSVLRKAHENL